MEHNWLHFEFDFSMSPFLFMHFLSSYQVSLSNLFYTVLHTTIIILLSYTNNVN